MADMTFGIPALQVLGLFGTGQRLHGYAVHQATKLNPSTAYAILSRFEETGLLVSERERLDPHLTRRVPRVVYSATTRVGEVLEEIRAAVGTAPSTA